MNAAAPTYELHVLLTPPPAETPAPRDTFVDRLVASLSETFALDDDERELALLLLLGRSIGAVARTLELPGREVQVRCRALFAATATDGRERLFELALRLTTMRELSTTMLGARA